VNKSDLQLSKHRVASSLPLLSSWNLQDRKCFAPDVESNGIKEENWPTRIG
jgi:hypothetical protein